MFLLLMILFHITGTIAVVPPSALYIYNHYKLAVCFNQPLYVFRYAVSNILCYGLQVSAYATCPAGRMVNMLPASFGV